MMLAALLRLCLSAQIVFEYSSSASAPAPAPSSPPIVKTDDTQWLASLDAAYLQSQRTGRPILVLIEDGPARDLQMVDSALSHESSDSWAKVCLDARQSKEAVRALGIAMTPAICALRPDGTILGTKSGRLDPANLSPWIDSMLQAANHRPTAASSTQECLSNLASPDEATRESAERQLSNDRSSAPNVVDILFDGPMSARLAALDLLEQWGPPVADIDPWNPASMTAPRRNSLQAWAKIPAPASRPSDSIDGLEIELDALLNAPTEIEARAVREQMVHFEPAALPAIRRRLNPDASEQAKQRLLALIYRLVATENLAEQWAGGFDRLASADPFVRRGAVDELSSRITADDIRLLVELFSNDDEYVRERSMRMLRSVGGVESNSALIHLLDDPEPNVRAAVLKTLGENPDPSLATDLARYVRSEKDPDLVVHGIGVLQQIPGDEAIDCLRDLLSHPAWRVRAEACEAIRAEVQSRDAIDPHQVASLVDALRKCLDDPDDFVIGQAAITLMYLNVTPATNAVIDAMGRHPSLVPDVLDALNRNQQEAPELVDGIRRLATNHSPQIRAAVIRAICRYSPNSAGAELAAGLKDSDPTVRQEAATGMATALEQLFPQNGVIYAVPGNYQSQSTNVDVAQWVQQFAAGQRRPEWMIGLKPDLQKLLSSDDQQTRVAAAMSLCGLGGQDQAWPILLKSADTELTRGTEAAALPWLDWDRRKMLWDRLAAITPDGQMPRLIEMFVAVPDQRATASLWDVLRDPPRDALLRDVHESLTKIYGVSNSPVYTGENFNGSVQRLPLSPSAQRCVDDANSMLEHGGELQKVEALCLIAQTDPPDVLAKSQQVFGNKSISASLRSDALQIVLLSQPSQTAEPIAAGAIADPEVRKIAVIYLARGGRGISAIRDNVYLNLSAYNADEFQNSGQGGSIIPVYVPAGIDAATIAKLLTDNDPDIVGYAGYLLAILGDPRGLPPLLRAVQAHGLADSDWAELAYRAISKLDDDSQTPMLEKIYQQYHDQDWELKQFYWTIRAMHGPNVLKLRKKIRDEVGMDKLE